MTKRFPLYQVDAFADSLFKGNPAAVVVLDEWLDNGVMQNIAAENNLSETAFIIPRDGYYDITWFTPVSEVDLCGHATLASAHVVFNHLGETKDEITFKTRQVGDLTVSKKDQMLYLDFPSRPAEKIDHVPAVIIEGLGGIAPMETYVSRDYILVYPDSQTIRAIKPDFKKLQQGGKWVCITAPGLSGDDCDFVSRMFCAGDGIEEDPVTGSTHCSLIPHWANKLVKTELIAKQLSERGGTLHCTLRGERVSIGGKALTYLEGTINI